MNIIFIDKINNNDNVINVCSKKNGNCIFIKNYMDILDFSINVKNIIKYNLNKKVFESAIKSADIAVPGFRRKIPLKFGDEAERKRAANKKYDSLFFIIIFLRMLNIKI